ncbi:hypothetical protein HUU59_09960 [bacterium]|nr:hypothetical protein [bacterium]
MKSTHLQFNKSASLVLLIAVSLLFAVGCGENGTSNPLSSQSNAAVGDAEATFSAKFPPQSVEPMSGEYKKEYCELKQIAYVDLKNELRCDAVTVHVDGAYFTTLEPKAAISTFIPAGKHNISFSRVKETRVLTSFQALLAACEQVEFKTGTDLCADAIQ